MQSLPFLNDKICPDLLRVPSGAMATQSPTLAEETAELTALTACSRLLRSIGTPPNAIKHHEKKGIKNRSDFPYRENTK